MFWCFENTAKGQWRFQKATDSTHPFVLASRAGGGGQPGVYEPQGACVWRFRWPCSWTFLQLDILVSFQVMADGYSHWWNLHPGGGTEKVTATHLKMPSVPVPPRWRTSSDRTVWIQGRTRSGYRSFCSSMMSSRVFMNMDGWKMDFCNSTYRQHLQDNRAYIYNIFY